MKANEWTADDLRENAAWDSWDKEEGWDKVNDAAKIASRWILGNVTRRIPIDLNVRLYLRPGYYEGAVLDYDIYYSAYNDTLTECRGDVDEFADEIAQDIEAELKHEYGWNAGLLAINHDKIRKAVWSTIEKARGYAEDFCKGYADEKLVCAGVFSNGEAIYERAE